MMKRTALFVATSAAMMMAGPVVAQVDSGQPNTVGTDTTSACLDELERMQTSEAGISDATRNDIRQLKDAARVLAERDQTDACNTVVQSIEDIRERERALLEEQQDLQALRSARPITKSQQVVKASSIHGATVRNTEDQELGTIEETVIDPKTGKVSYVVLSHGGFVGVGEKLIAVPWDELHVVEGDNAQETFYVLPASNEYLNQREGLGEQDWPAEPPAEWNPGDPGGDAR